MNGKPEYFLTIYIETKSFLEKMCKFTRMLHFLFCKSIRNIYKIIYTYPSIMKLSTFRFISLIFKVIRSTNDKLSGKISFLGIHKPVGTWIKIEFASSK